MEKFTIGLIVGGAIGAILVANNCKMRTLVKKSQEEVKARLDEMMDEKIREMEDGATELKEKAETVVEKIKDEIKPKNAQKE